MIKTFEYNFPEHRKGDTFSGVSFEVLVNSSPINLTGAVIKMQLRVSSNTPAVIDYDTIGGEITITDAANGKFQINKQIIDIPFKKYLYDIQITLQNGDVFTYIKGSWNIVADITHNG